MNIIEVHIYFEYQHTLSLVEIGVLDILGAFGSVCTCVGVESIQQSNYLQRP